MTKPKKIVMTFSLAVLLILGFYAVSHMAPLLSANNSASIDVSELYSNPDEYDLSQADGAASIIIMEDLQKTNTVNAVTAVVFDFRGYDTLGESFVLITAITGTMVVIRQAKHGKPKEEEKEVSET